MRIAVIVDVHGNSHALEAVLEDAQRQHVDEIVMAGDTVNLLPNSRPCWEMAFASGARVLKGNHELYISSRDRAQNLALLEEQAASGGDRFKPTRWCAAQFSDAELEVMRHLPFTAQFPDLLVMHATPDDLFAHVLEDTPPEELSRLFAASSEPVLVRGHNHHWLERRFDGRIVTTVGSCGIPTEGRTETQYAILTRTGSWSLERHFVPYDREGALATLGDAYLETHGPLGAILRHELLTAQNHWVQFLETYLDAVDNGELSLAAAVERHLS